MCKFEEDFKQAIDNLCKEYKYNVDYSTVGSDPEVLLMARIRGGSSGLAPEIIITARGCKVIIPETDIEKTFKKNELNRIIDCVKDILENPIEN